MKNRILNIIVVVLSACIFLSFFFYTKGINFLINELKTLNIYWLLAAAALIVFFWTFETLVLHVIIKSLCNKQSSFIKTLRFQMVGQFFGAITPFSSGSHPAQLVEMSKYEIPPGLAGSVLIIKFIIHEAVIILYLTLALLFKFKYFSSKINFFLYFCILGFIVHLLVISSLFLFSVSSKTTKNILTFIVKVLGKIRIVKNVEHALEKVESQLVLFHENAILITKRMKMCIYASIFTFLQWLAFFSIPYCIYRSFGFNSSDLCTMIAAQIFLTNFMSIIPLPGAEGGAEGGFYIIYGIFFRNDTIITAILVWRVLTYYLTIIVSSIFTLVLPNKKWLKNKN